MTLATRPASLPPATLQEAVERRKAEMAKRDEEREKVKVALAAERAEANAEAQRQAHARIQAAQQANVAIIQVWNEAVHGYLRMVPAELPLVVAVQSGIRVGMLVCSSTCTLTPHPAFPVPTRPAEEARRL